MMHGTAPVKSSVIGCGDAYDLAVQNNALQAIAEKTRLGIPVTISTDPRNAAEALVGASSSSQWPETLGIAATASESLARRYAEQVRREYRGAFRAAAL